MNNGRSAPIWHRPKPYPKGLTFLQSAGGTARPFYPALYREQIPDEFILRIFAHRRAHECHVA